MIQQQRWRFLDKNDIKSTHKNATLRCRFQVSKSTSNQSGNNNAAAQCRRTDRIWDTRCQENPNSHSM